MGKGGKGQMLITFEFNFYNFLICFFFCTYFNFEDAFYTWMKSQPGSETEESESTAGLMFGGWRWREQM